MSERTALPAPPELPATGLVAQAAEPANDAGIDGKHPAETNGIPRCLR